MIINCLKRVLAVALFAIIGINMGATNIDNYTARMTANRFLKQRVASPGSINAPTLADLKLVHVESSSVDRNANAYYAFNVNGGGFVIVAGDDRISQVLGFSDEGQLDFRHLPENMKALLDFYKEEIEYLQANPKLKVPKRTSNNRNVIVEPLVTAHFGQLMPYYLQCPMSDSLYSRVGCSGAQMAQIVHYWQYPTTCGPLPAYYCPKLHITIEELPATTFDYSKMLTSYCHWDSHQKVLIQDSYTEEQANEVAKLCRYVGQAAKMNYSPTGSGTDGFRKLAAMKILGYNPDAISVARDDGYTTEEWESLMRAELDAGQPIMYGGKNGVGGAGHAYIFDGYDSEGYFHINWGWYGVNDGWFLTTALATTYYTGSGPRNYNVDQYMFLGIRPPFYCNVNAQNINTNDGFFLMGGLFNLQVHATDVNISTSYDALDLVFTITDANDNIVAASDTINVLKSDFTQHSNINSAIAFPESLTEGTYNLNFNYIVDNKLNTIASIQGELYIAGRLAKFNSPFNMDDLTDLINILVFGNNTQFRMDDLTSLINYLVFH